MGVDSAGLIKTLNPTCLGALDGAAALCFSRTNPTVEIEHWLTRLVEAPDSDLTRIFTFFEVDPARVLRDLTQGDRPVPHRQPAHADALPEDRRADPSRLGAGLDPVRGAEGPLGRAAAGPAGR